jgi:hypothetical protein
LLPFILIGAALFCGGAGAKKAVDGASMSGRADDISNAATIRLRAAEERLQKAVRSGEAAFKRLEKTRANARSFLTEEVAATLRRMAGVDHTGFTEFESALARPERLTVALGAPSAALISGIGAGLTGLRAGMVLSAAAQGGVATLGVASTGASISGLSGAAATNATMAWFGGGSIASGGLGMAGGAAALGGLVVAPAVLLAGLVYANRAEERLTQATIYSEKVKTAIEQGKSAERRISAIKRRTTEVRKAIDDVSERVRIVADPLNSELDKLTPESSSFALLVPELQNKALMLGVLAGLLSELVEVSIIDEAACLLDDSGAVLARVKAAREIEQA